MVFHNTAELAQRGHDVHIFAVTVTGEPSEDTIDGVQAHWLRLWRRWGVVRGVVGGGVGCDLMSEVKESAS